MALPAADDRLLRQNAGLLAELAARHGISSIQLGTDVADLVVAVGDGGTHHAVLDRAAARPWEHQPQSP